MVIGPGFLCWHFSLDPWTAGIRYGVAVRLKERGFPDPYVRIPVWLGRTPDAELPQTYSITSSARTSSVGDTSSASALEIDH
jgi:hypothetical protein